MKRTIARLTLLAIALGAAAALALAAAQPAQGSRALIKGVFDEAEVIGRPEKTFPVLRTLRTEAVRVNIYWNEVAKRKPLRPADPADKAYNWTGFDRMVGYAARYRIKVVMAIVGTPRWANGGKARSYPPKRMLDLRNFAYAAALRYSGSYTESEDVDAKPLPAVRHWLAWNEPNNPVFLRPQYKRVKGGWRVESAYQYARICNAIQAGIRATVLNGEKIACGVTAPRGNNSPSSARASVSPLAFIRALKRYGARGFDAYAHHPYYGARSETPSTRPKAETAVTLGNIDDLVGELTRLFGKKRLWITEYGYQTSPQDKFFGVTYQKQAAYLKQAFAIARKHPRIDMMLWFLIRDQQAVAYWQSGFYTYGRKRKPSFSAFRNVRP
ncbi:MAG: glycosyl hydrolase [Actinomycetota bacterium]|nr:glycosyl hydrolase [Actinomycetota bacterium]